MNLSQFSLTKKLLLSTLPVFLATGAVGYMIHHISTRTDSEAERAMHMIDYVNSEELAMVEMSEALRGYLINPDNTGEYEKKKAADAAYSDFSDKLGTIVVDSPDITALNKQMADYDASTLDKIESAVADLIKAKDPKAISFYAKTYAPARKVQDESFYKLKEMVHARANAILEEIKNKRAREGDYSALLLLISTWEESH